MKRAATAEATAPPTSPWYKPLRRGAGQPPEEAVDGQPAPERQERQQRRWLAGVIVAGYLLSLLWRLWIARQLFTPIVFGDESRYLIFGRVLAGGAGGFGGDTEATRRAGYGLLISPAYWFTSDPFLVHRLVQGLNAVISAATFPLAYLFARRVLASDRRWSIGIAAVAASLPAVSFFAPFVLPNAVLTPLLLVWLLSLHTWWTAGTDRLRLLAAAGSGLAIGFMYVVHVRALLLLAVHALALVALLLVRRVRLPEVLASAGAAGLMMVVNPLLRSLLRGKVVTGGTEPEDRMTAAFTTIDGILRTVSDGTGQLWYVFVGTWGVGAVGLVWAVYCLVRDRRQLLRPEYRWPSAMVLVMCLLSTVLIVVITSAALPDDGKVNNHIFPGYIIFMAPVWVMVGLAGLRQASRRAVVITGVATLAVVAASWFIVELYTRPSGGIGPPGAFFTIDAPEPLFLIGDWTRVHLAEVTGITLGFVLLIALALGFRRLPQLGVALLVGVVMINFFALQASTEQMAGMARYQAGPQLVRDGGVRPGELVAVDNRLTVRFNHQREVYWAPLVDINLARTPPPDNVDLVVGYWYSGDPARDWDGAKQGWTFVTGSSRMTWALWRRAGT